MVPLEQQLLANSILPNFSSSCLVVLLISSLVDSMVSTKFPSSSQDNNENGGCGMGEPTLQHDGVLSEIEWVVSLLTAQQYVVRDVSHEYSTAGRFAILDATGVFGAIEKCVYAAGCYVSEDASELQLFSTCRDSHIRFGDSGIKQPREVISHVVNNIVPVPYCIPGELTKSDLRLYEDKCLGSLVASLYRASVNGKPIKALWMELVLSGNGGSLSEQALVYIARICRRFGVNIIIDERNTACRAGLDTAGSCSFLLLQHTPPEFQACVSHVVLGGPLKGLCLCSSGFFKKCVDGRYHRDGKRSSLPCLDKQLVFLKDFMKRKDYGVLFQQEKARALCKLHVAEPESWGAGMLIFVAERIFRRRLPLSSSPIRIRSLPARSRALINQAIMESILCWLVDPSSDADLALCFLLCSKYTVGRYDKPDKIKTLILQQQGGSVLNAMMIRGAITRAVNSNYLVNSQKRSARERVVVLLRELHYESFPHVCSKHLEPITRIPCLSTVAQSSMPTTSTTSSYTAMHLEPNQRSRGASYYV